MDPLFAFRTALILRGIDSTRCWNHSSEILVHIDMIASRSCCRFVVCTFMMWISRSTTSQRCSIGLRSAVSGGDLSLVNSLSCSRNQSEMIWALWIYLEAGITRLVHCSVVTVPKSQYSVPIPVNIHGSQYQSKTQSMLIKQDTIFINKVKYK